MLACRGIRGATTTEENTDSAIYTATRELLSQLIEANQLTEENVAAAYFTVTPDLNAAFPAAAARQLGWNTTALMCSTEIPVPGSLPQCIRIMVLYNTEKPQQEIVNIYLKGTESLRLQGVQSS
ncbi:MAG: chorismate mutase [Chloroflexi bacterium]|nr:chorismate mutase [Chloroflexota bacterium]